MASVRVGQTEHASAAPLFTEAAYAKINLGLRITGRRSDGYHDLVTCMQTVDLCDQLRAQYASRTRFTCSDPRLSTGPDNLVSRALELFAREVAVVPPLEVHLIKRIPMGAGLGGGSADAAAMLRLLNRICGSPCTWNELRALAIHLGADVPFLIRGGTALATGRGEVLQPVRWQGTYQYVLVSPEVHVSTSWAYAQLDASLTAVHTARSFHSFMISGGYVDHERLVSSWLENDFEPVVSRAFPIVADLLSRLRNRGAIAVTMTGSGSTVLGIYDDRNAAGKAHQALKAEGYRSFFCQAVEPPNTDQRPVPQGAEDSG